LRARFVRSELSLFRERFDTDDAHERAAFLRSKTFDWIAVNSEDKAKYAAELRACMPWGTKDDAFRAESWFKVRYILLYCVRA
jgi:DNA primase large subunit